VSVRRCPDCGCDGGGGDGPCCACPLPCAFFVRGDEDRELPVPFTSSISDLGSLEVGCCEVARPGSGTNCPLSPLVGAGSDLISGVLEATGPGFGTGCGATGFQNTTEQALVSDCDQSSIKTGPRDFDFRVLSGFGEDERNCPQVIMPSQPGAIYTWDNTGDLAIVTAWGGSRVVRGPLAMVHHQRFFWADPGGGGAGCAFWVFVGLGGGVSVIAVTAARCRYVPCVGGQTADQGTIRISGGASAGGSIDCAGAVSLTAAFNAAVTLGCDIGPMGECYETGEYVADFSFDAGLDLGSIVHECQEHAGRGSESGVVDQDTVGGFFIPEAFLHANPELQAAYDRLRQHLGNDDGGQTQVPPPNTLRGAGDWF